MPDIRSCLEATGGDAAGDAAVLVHVHAQPGAGRSEVVGRHGDAVKVRVAAPPEAGRANDAICALLAKEVGVAASAVTVAKGATSRTKVVRIAGADIDQVEERLEEAAGGGGRKGPARRR